MRSRVACQYCRGRKVKCINDGSATLACRDCSALERKCIYEPRGRQKKPSRSITNAGSLSNAKIRSLSSAVERNRSTSLQAGRKNGVALSILPSPSRSGLALPGRQLLLEVVDIFYDNQYQGIFQFVHKPSLYAFLRSPEFKVSDFSLHNNGSSNLLVILGILALCARFHPRLVSMYGAFDENHDPEHFTVNYNCGSPGKLHYVSWQASAYFGWHAHRLLGSCFDSPSLERIQALTMLSSHEWGAGNPARGFMYVGIAARMAGILGLGFGDSKIYTAEHDHTSEIKRRTIWAVYMMDKCIASGHQRSSSMSITDVHVAVPSSEESFYFDLEINEITYGRAQEAIHSGVKTELTPYAYEIVLFEIWAKVAKWVGEVGGRKELTRPWDESSSFAKLSRELEVFLDSLPRHLLCTPKNLEAHLAKQTAGWFAYLHQIYFLCRIFLNREYFFLNPSEAPAGWWMANTEQLVDACLCCSRIIGSLFAMRKCVIAPFTGYQLFTLAGMSLYIAAVPGAYFEQHSGKSGSPLFFDNGRNTIGVTHGWLSPNQSVNQVRKQCHKTVGESLQLLEEWSSMWAIVKQWYDLIVRLQNKGKNILVQDETEVRAMTTYGNSEVVLREQTESDTVSSGDSSSENVEDVSTDPSLLLVDETPRFDFLGIDIATILPGWTSEDFMSH